MTYSPAATPSPSNRIVAWLIDWLCILGWVAVTAVVAVPLYLAGALHLDDPVAQNLVAALVIVVPVTVTMAVLESGAAAASVVKRVRRLVVVDIDTRLPLTFSRSLLRSSLKIALPWLCAHAGVYGLLNSGGSSPPWWAVLAIIASYVLAIVWVVSLFIRSGRAPYDRAARSIVTNVTAEFTISRPQRTGSGG